MADYTFSVTDDFPNQTVDLSVLQAEIEANSTINGEASLDGISIDGDTVTVTFDVSLSGPAETELNTIVGNHTGEGLVEGTQRVTSEGEQTSSSNNWSSAASLNSGPLKAGDYEVTWYCEHSTENADSNSGSQVQLLWQDSQRGLSTKAATSFYDGYSGSAVVTMNDLSTPTMEVQFRRIGTANTSKIRRIRLAIIPIYSDSEEE